MTWPTVNVDGKRVFVTRDPFTGFRPVTQTNGMDRNSPFGKPTGLWYGVGDSWLDWVTSEMPARMKQQRYLYEIEVDERAMLLVRDVAAFDAFNRDYAVQPHREISMTTPDWRLLAMATAGIEIAPYLWERRFEPLWYYGWDCASGCVWNARAIRTVTLLEQRDVRVVAP